MSLRRGCGERQPGGIYLEFPIGPGGHPLEDFILCPPHPVDPAWGVTPIATRQFDTFIFDWIGSAHWPNVADYLEEVRRFGVSARLPRNLDFSIITQRTVFCPIHNRGLNIDWWLYPPRQHDCPRHEHHRHDGPCAGYHWEDLTGGSELDRDFYLDRPMRREMPSFVYTANARPDLSPEPGLDPKGQYPRYAPAVIAAFPCSRLVVVRGEGHDEALKIAKRAEWNVPVVSVDE